MVTLSNWHLCQNCSVTLVELEVLRVLNVKHTFLLKLNMLKKPIENFISSGIVPIGIVPFCDSVPALYGVQWFRYCYEMERKQALVKRN